jgi:glutaredoxin
VDVKSDPAKLREMLKFSGGSRQVPVIVKGTEVTIGYGGS